MISHSSPTKLWIFRKQTLCIRINEWLNSNDQAWKDFEWYCKTLKFFKNHGDAASGERTRTLENFRIRNHELMKKIRYKLEQKFADTRCISEQRIVEPDQINGSTPADRMRNILDKHLSGIYKNHKLAEGYAKNQADLKRSAADQQTMMPHLTSAEQTVNDLITNYNDQMTVHDLVQEFAKPPFGWRHEAVLDILVHLVKKKKREFKYRNQPRYPIVDFINKAVSTAERVVCEVCSGAEIDQATIDEALFHFRDIFNRELPATTDGNELFEMLVGELKKELMRYQPFEDAYHGSYPFGVCFHETTKLLNTWANMRDPRALFSTLTSGKDQAKKLLDTAKGMAEFADANHKDYDAIRTFYQANRENFLELTPDAQEKAEKIGRFLKMDDPRFEYRHIRKAYDEVKKALDDLKKALLEEVIGIYEAIFRELEQEKARRGITDAIEYADLNGTLQGINRLESIAQLRNKKLGAHEFKTEQLQSIIEYAASQSSGTTATTVGEPEVYYVSRVRATISNATELDEYLAKVRQDMLELIQNNKTIIIK